MNPRMHFILALSWLYLKQIAVRIDVLVIASQHLRLVIVAYKVVFRSAWG